MAKKQKRFYLLHCEVCNFPTHSIQAGNKAEDRKKFTGTMKYCKKCRKHTPQVQRTVPKPQ